MLDVFKGNASKIEMSRYIDLDLYHAVERTHPFYVEMIDDIRGAVADFFGDRSGRVWEFGAGTGLATEELLAFPGLTIDALDLDSSCCDILREHVGPRAEGRVAVICEDALTHRGAEPYDMALSVFAHDHIPYRLGTELARSIRANLRTGGIYVMGGELLPVYHDEATRREALYRYHCFIVEHALRAENFEVAQIEINALKSGLHSIGDFKRHEAAFEAELLSADFQLIRKTKIGPGDRDDVGGVFVYVFEAV